MPNRAIIWQQMKYNNKVLTIVSENLDGEPHNHTEEECLRASYCYLHSELERMAGFDIFSLLKSEILPEHQGEHWISEDFPDGEYEATCFDQPCTFFIWKRPHRSGGGLVVLNSDQKAYDYAKNCYETKKSNI